MSRVLRRGGWAVGGGALTVTEELMRNGKLQVIVAGVDRNGVDAARDFLQSKGYSVTDTRAAGDRFGFAVFRWYDGRPRWYR